MEYPTLPRTLMIFIVAQGILFLLYKTGLGYVTKAETPQIHRHKVPVFKGKYQYFTFTIIPRLANRKNNAIVNIKYNCLSEKQPFNSSAYITVITNYHSVEVDDFNIGIYGRPAPTIDDIQARKAEILQTLQENLNHALVSKIYVFVQFYESAVFLNSLDLVNSEKLVIQFTNETILLAKTMMFISKCLRNKIVLKLHQDNKIGRGFEVINRDVLIKNRLMYALTRQPSREYCYHSWNKENCDVGPYVGSHDAFMFHVKKYRKTDFKQLKTSNAQTNDLGMENVFLWVFKNVLKYKILNPCKILHIHHEHCVPIRKKVSRRINKKLSTLVGYTNHLS